MPTSTLSNPVVSQIGTPTTNAMGPDGFTWASATFKIIDKYGKSVMLAEASNGDHYFVYSNDGEVTWADSLVQVVVTRGDMAYNAVDDRVYVFWDATDPVDGMLFREYTFTRDGSNNITAVVRDSTVNTRIDYQGSDASDPAANMRYGFPRIVYLDDVGFGGHGAVLLSWVATNLEVAHLGTEIRTTMRTLSNGVADNDPTNWHAPRGTPATTTIGNRPGVNGNLPYNALSSQTGLGMTGMMADMLRPLVGAHARDVYVAWTDYNVAASSTQLRFLRMTWVPLSLDWSGTAPVATTISLLKRAGTDSGYNLKGELPSKFAYNIAADCLYVAFPNWKDNASGDTVSVVRINCVDDTVSPLVDVYSAGGAHSYAPSCDVVWDAAAERVAVSYIKQTTQQAAIKTYTATLVPDQSEFVYYAANPVDIPLLYGDRIGGKLVSTFRDTSGTYVGYQVAMTWTVVADAAPAAPAGGGSASRARLGRTSLLLDRYLNDEERARLGAVYGVGR